ncbi:MAG: hypothetical protein NTV06_07130 [candidate division Zixibacteria bacterium]|nr:hypothetical protein [candidate division Zixibacteria bacterium]
MINRIVHKIAMVFALSVLLVQPASANPGSRQIISALSVFNFLVLVAAVVGLLWAFKILTLVRGGLMSRSWQMFILGFGFLMLAQILALAAMIGISTLPEYIPAILYLLMGGSWLMGLYHTRKVLN